LITDRVEESMALARVLALWGASSVVDLSDAPTMSKRPLRLILSDVDLSKRESVEALRAALAECRVPGTPYLCLMRETSPRSTMQANVLGATGILDVGAPVPVLLDRIGQMLLSATGRELDEREARMQQHFAQASVALGDMLAAAAEGKALPVAAIDVSVASINRAADEVDLGGWLDMVWNHDDLTYQHCLLVAGLAAAFARQLGFPEEARKLLTCAAVLHDIGKAKIPTAILHKPGSLTPAELSIVRAHPRLGYEMLRDQGSFARDIVEVAHRHHEYLDGTGYPQGLKGNEISDVVRMITICDIYAALIERRSYKAPMAPQAAYQTLLGMGGKLDADLLRAFRAVVLSDCAEEARAASA
jgi:putative nucleotidyltransferase with HDIG domain